MDLGEPTGSGPGYLRPHVVIQNNVFNLSRINTVVICAVTSNLKRGRAPGNVTLRQGEANLPRPSVVNISQLYTVAKSVLYDKIGTLSERRMLDIIRGIQLLIEPRDLA